MGYKGTYEGEYLSFKVIKNLIGTKETKCIGNNTYVERGNGQDMVLRHWSTNIVTFRPDGSMLIDLNGYTTSTTLARIRTYLRDIRIYSNRGDWVITNGDGLDYWYQDGIEVSPSGEILNAWPVIEKLLSRVTGKEYPDRDSVFKGISELTFEQCQKVWKRAGNNRPLIAKYCQKEFLPLIVGSDVNGEAEVVAERLRQA